MKKKRLTLGSVSEWYFKQQKAKEGLKNYLIQFDDVPLTDDPEYAEFLEKTPLEDEFTDYDAFLGMKSELAQAIEVMDSAECICGLHQVLFNEPDPECEWHKAARIASDNEYCLGY